jgi:Bacterial dnaA protein helix-turn-helix
MLARMGPLFQRQMQGAAREGLQRLAARVAATRPAGPKDFPFLPVVSPGFAAGFARLTAAAFASDVAASPVFDLAQRRRTFAEVVREVTGRHGVSVAEVKGGARTRRVCVPRFEICWAGCYELGLSTTRVGSLLGRDHTSVLNGRDRVDAVFREAFGVTGAEALLISADRRIAALAAAFAVSMDREAVRKRERARARAEARP